MIDYILGISVWFVPMILMGVVLQPVQDWVARKGREHRRDRYTQNTQMSSTFGGSSLQIDSKAVLTGESVPIGAFRSIHKG